MCPLFKLFIAFFILFIDASNMNCIYHGCMTKNADGTNKIILAGEKFLVPTAKCFWKYPRDIECMGAKTRSQTK